MYVKISIVIPSYGGLGRIPENVQLIREKYGHKDVEIIIMLEGLSDEAEKKAKELANKYKLEVVISRERKGKVNALNEGISHSHGDAVIFIDSDAKIVGDIVTYVREALKNGDFGSGVILFRARNLLQRMENIDYLGINTIVYFMTKDNYSIGLNGAFIFAKKEVLDKIGGFAHEIVEDIDFGIRASEAGFRPVFIKKPCVETTGPATIKGWFKQRKRWAVGGAAVILKHLRAILRRWKVTLKNTILAYPAFAIYLLLFLLPNAYVEKLATTVLTYVTLLFPPILPLMYILLAYFGVRNLFLLGLGFIAYLGTLLWQKSIFQWKLHPADPLLYYFIYGPIWFMMTLGALLYVLIKGRNVTVSGWKV